MSRLGLGGAIAAIWVGATLFAISTSAQESLADLPSFREGAKALADSRYETASEKFLETWSLLESQDAGDIEKGFVAARLIESFIGNGETDRAVSWIEANPLNNPTPSAQRWTAAALQKTGRFAEAAATYATLGRQVPLQRSDSINFALSLALAGSADRAFETLTTASEGRGITPKRPKEIIQFAQIATQAGQFEWSADLLRQLDPAESLDYPARFALARLKLWNSTQLGDQGTAIKEACALIDSATSEREAHLAFLLLEKSGFTDQSSLLSESLKKWMSSPEHPAASAAVFFSTIFDTAAENLEEALSTFLEENPTSSFADEARFRLSRPISIEEESQLPGGNDRLSFSSALNAYQQLRFDEAIRQFAAIAESFSGETRLNSLFNTAIAALKANDQEQFAKAKADIQAKDPSSPLLIELSYLGGLHFASENRPEAVGLLETFTRENPNHPANVDALLALAEIHLNQAPARPQAAREIFEGLRLRPLSIKQSERLEYASVWLEYIDLDSNQLIEQASRFLREWPSSDYFAEIAMLLGRQHFEQRDFPKALALFERIAERRRKSSFTEDARFFAIRSMPADEKAVEAWESLINQAGKHQSSAKQELGLLLINLDRFEEAIAHFETIIEAEDTPEELVFASIANLGFAHYSAALKKGEQSEQFKTAANTFARLASSESAPKVWRINAAVRQAKCLEALGEKTKALTLYESVLGNEASDALGLPEPTTPEETSWVFRAGFAAISLLEENQQWLRAINIADTLSKKNGPRAIEAARLSEQLRLEHWVWN